MTEAMAIHTAREMMVALVELTPAILLAVAMGVLSLSTIRLPKPAKI